MFNLIITIMALAFVVTLAAITATHLGSEKGATVTGRNAITATQALAQGAQLTSQAIFFNAFERRWPDSVQELIAKGYIADEPLMSLPASSDIASTAVTKNAWHIPVPGIPLFTVAATIAELPCRQLNQQIRGDNGILTLASPELIAQCFGAPGAYQIVVGATQDSVADALGAVLLPGTESLQGLRANLASSYWAVPPDSADTE